MDLIIIGGGSFCNTVYQVARSMNKNIYGVCDAKFNKGETSICGLPIVGKDFLEIENYNQFEYIVAIGNMDNRKLIYERLAKNGCKITTLIDKRAIVIDTAEIAEGCIILYGALVDEGCKIGKGTILSVGAIVTHGCIVGDYCLLGTNAVVGASCVIGNQVLIGIGSIVNLGKKVANRVCLATGSVLTKNVYEDGSKLLGIPAKLADYKINLLNE